MRQEFFNYQVNTNGQQLYEFTSEIIQWVNKKKFKNGILNLNIQHTSASLIVQENADPDVQTDLVNYFNSSVEAVKNFSNYSQSAFCDANMMLTAKCNMEKGFVKFVTVSA